MQRYWRRSATCQLGLKCIPVYRMATGASFHFSKVAANSGKSKSLDLVGCWVESLRWRRSRLRQTRPQSSLYNGLSQMLLSQGGDARGCGYSEHVLDKPILYIRYLRLEDLLGSTLHDPKFTTNPIWFSCCGYRYRWRTVVDQKLAGS